VRDRRDVGPGLANRRAALDQVSAVEGLMTRLSRARAGVSDEFLFTSHKAYVEAIAHSDAGEKRRSSMRVLSCSSTAPIWQWRTTQFQDLNEGDFLKRAAFHSR